MIQKVFHNNNTNKLSGHVLVEELISLVGAPDIAESQIMEAVQSGELIQDGKHFIIDTPTPSPAPVEEDVNSEIKKAWFQLRQLEKKNPKASKFKIYAESFIRQFGWNYYIFDKELREQCETLGYKSVPEERALFQKEVLQK